MRHRNARSAPTAAVPLLLCALATAVCAAWPLDITRRSNGERDARLDIYMRSFALGKRWAPVAAGGYGRRPVPWVPLRNDYYTLAAGGRAHGWRNTGTGLASALGRTYRPVAVGQRVIRVLPVRGELW